MRAWKTGLSSHNNSEMDLSDLRRRARALGGRFQLKASKSEYLVRMTQAGWKLTISCFPWHERRRAAEDFLRLRSRVVSWK